MTVEVFVADEQDAFPVDTLRWVRLAEAVLVDEGVAGDAELSMLFVDEGAIADLNKRFLGRDGPTDVLAFPIDEEPIESGRSPDSGGTGPGFSGEVEEAPTLLGDVVICPAVAHRNAPQHAGTYEDELALLVVHGVLHLLGMDHLDDDEAEEMEERERVLLTAHHGPIPALGPHDRHDDAPAPEASPGSPPAGATSAADAGAAEPGAVDAADGPAPDSPAPNGEEPEVDGASGSTGDRPDGPGGVP